MRQDKDRVTGIKRSTRQPANTKNNLPHVTEGSEIRDINANKTSMPKISSALSEVHDWWTEQINYETQSSDEEEEEE